MNKIKAIGFDGWTMGVNHYIRLLDAFDNDNIDLSLIHLGSWGEDKNRKKEENINGLNVRDILFYKTLSFSEILDLEKPDVVIFLSTQTFAHRAFQRYCHQKYIPTICLYHGLYSSFLIDGKSKYYQVNVIGLLIFIIKQSYKSLRYSFPVYAKSLWQTKADFSDWLRFVGDIISRLRGETIFVPAIDSVPTKCCVYISADIQDPISRFKLKKNDVVVVGNPDLIALNVKSHDIGIFLDVKSSEFVNVMYIDTGLASAGLNFQSVKTYSKYLLDIGAQLRTQNRILLFKIKPFPSDYKEYLSSVLLSNNIEVIDNNEFVVKLKTCCACITEPSTLGLIPCLLGLPLLLNRYGPLKSLMYGKIFTTYPRAQYLDDICSFNDLLLKEKVLFDPDKVMAWINENSGPMPAEDMPKRVAQVVKNLITDNKRSFNKSIN